MNRIKIFYISLFAALFTALMYQGCSQLDTNAVMAPEINIHPAGWADTLHKDSPNFHAKYIYNNKLWNLTLCRSCHGSDYKGGTAGISCLTCHTRSNGPENCRTCHGGVSGHANPPSALNGDTSVTSLGVGAHMTHLYNSRWSAQLECEECHVFNGFDDPAHIGPNPDGVAEITFGPLANNILQGDTTSVPNPAWNRITASCSNVYCHGTFRMGNKTAAGNWIYPPSVVCGSCHGNPLTGNPTPRDSNGVFHDPHPIELQVTSCYICHGSVINGSGTIFNKDLHVNGAVNY